MDCEKEQAKSKRFLESAEKVWHQNLWQLSSKELDQRKAACDRIVNGFNQIPSFAKTYFPIEFGALQTTVLSYRNSDVPPELFWRIYKSGKFSTSELVDELRGRLEITTGKPSRQKFYSRLHMEINNPGWLEHSGVTTTLVLDNTKGYGEWIYKTKIEPNRRRSRPNPSSRERESYRKLTEMGYKPQYDRLDLSFDKRIAAIKDIESVGISGLNLLNEVEAWDDYPLRQIKPDRLIKPVREKQPSEDAKAQLREVRQLVTSVRNRIIRNHRSVLSHSQNRGLNVGNGIREDQLQKIRMKWINKQQNHAPEK